MPAPNPITTLRLPASVRRHLDVATASATRTLAGAHAEEVMRLLDVVGDAWAFDETVDYYVDETGIGPALGQSLRNRVLVRLDEEDRLDPSRPSLRSAEQGGQDEERGDEGWKRFRPDRIVKELRQRQRRQGRVERWAQLVLAQAEEEIIGVHVENALDFAALLEEHLDTDRAVSYYVDAIGLGGCRAQTVVQRSMARIAEALLDPHTPPRGGIDRD